MTIYCKFTVELVYERLLKSTSGEVTGKKADCLMHSVHLGTVLLKDEELARDLEYGKKQLSLTVVTSIFTWLRQWFRPILTCQLTPSETMTKRWWCATGFCCKAFFLVAAAAYSQLFCELLGTCLLVSKLNNAHISRRVFCQLRFSVAESSTTVWVVNGSLFMHFLKAAIS